MNIQRRTFLAASLVVWPISRMLPIQHSEYTIDCQTEKKLFRFVIRTFTNGGHSITFNGKPMPHRSTRHDWWLYSTDDWRTDASIEFRVASPDRLSIRRIRVVHPQETFVEDFSFPSRAT